MNNSSRTILIVIAIFVLACGILFFGTNYIRMHGGLGSLMGNQGSSSGGLIAVTANGKPLEIDSSKKFPENTASQKAGGLDVTFSISPYPPVGFKETRFDATLKDAKGLPVTDAKIILDLTMPAMPMPNNKIEAVHTENGLYHADGNFTMRGLWHIEVIIDRGGQQQSAFFDVNL